MSLNEVLILPAAALAAVIAVVAYHARNMHGHHYHVNWQNTVIG